MPKATRQPQPGPSSTPEKTESAATQAPSNAEAQETVKAEMDSGGGVKDAFAPTRAQFPRSGWDSPDAMPRMKMPPLPSPKPMGDEDRLKRMLDSLPSPGRDALKPLPPPLIMKYGILPVGPKPGQDGCPSMSLPERLRPFGSELESGPPTVAMMYGMPPVGLVKPPECPPIMMKYGIMPPGISDMPPSPPMITMKYGILPGSRGE
ncbi:MAG: hypothetical protein JRI25_17560 [Deltaproteobacteria bacterium]|nr:hypothetical protein [Deltaproteobacteria bacterium]